MTETTEKKTESIHDLVVPASPSQVLEAMRLFEEFKRQALTQNDYVILETREGKKPYIKKSGWMKFALACQLSLQKRDERLEERPDGSKVYHYTYRAVAPNGRYADAVGSAATSERAFAHPDHDVRSLAQTRACNRAISNLVSGGEVSAEEMVSEVKEERISAPPQIPSPSTPSPTNIPAETKAKPVSSSQNTWRVPVTPNQLSPDQIERGVRQFPLLKGLRSFGMINQLEDEISIVPERPIAPESSPLKWFIEGTPYRDGVVIPLCQKHGLKWARELDSQGQLRAIMVFGGSLEKKQVDELISGALWTFKTILEDAKP
jgi:hypothetical protein